MSQENVETVRRYNAPYEGDDLIPMIREAVERVGPDPEPDKYRDLGDWVLTPTAIEARGRGGIAVDGRVFQLWQVRDGKIAVLGAFLTEQEALEAVGLRE